MSALLRALHLRDLHRYEEAVALLTQHLAEQPDDAQGHAELAITRSAMPGERGRALESIDAAISLEADNATYFGLRSLILSQLHRYPEALQAGQVAIGLDPDDLTGWLGMCDAHCGQSEWVSAEWAIRKVLELDPDNGEAQNRLAMVLRLQGKLEAADAGTDQRLERDPEDAGAHANAGWAALQRGNGTKAEEHFGEALRIDPECEYARAGLLEAFKARAWFYRLFLRWVFFLQRFSEVNRFLVIVGILVAARFGRLIAERIHPAAAVAVVIAYLTFVFGGFIASGLGHLLLLKDRRARLVLDRAEKLEGLFVGGGFLVGLVLVVGGLVGLGFGVVLLGGALMVSAIPGSMFWTNESRLGRWIFGGITAFVVLTGMVCLVQDLNTGDAFAMPAGFLVGAALLLGVASSWLSMIPRLHRATDTAG